MSSTLHAPLHIMEALLGTLVSPPIRVEREGKGGYQSTANYYPQLASHGVYVCVTCKERKFSARVCEQCFYLSELSFCIIEVCYNNYYGPT